MSKDNFSSNDKLMEGIRKITSVIAPTYGPGGTNVIIRTLERPFYRSTNDGKLILDGLKLDDEIEETGRLIMAHSTDTAERESGDGRKTTCLLTSAIMDETWKSEEDAMTLYHSLQDCIPAIFDSIEKQKKIITVDEVKGVASIAADNKNIGKLVQEIYQAVGKDAIIEIDTSGLPETFYTLTEGFRIRTGCLGEYSKNSEEYTKGVYLNPLILISKEKITSKDQLEPIFKFLKQNGKDELVIFTEDIDLTVLSSIARTHLEGGFKTMVIKVPILFKDWIYEDLSKLTGATPIDFKNGKTFKSVIATDFGTCEKVTATAYETRVIGTKDIKLHIKNLEEMAHEDNQLKVRISWLQSKIAILKVGGNSDAEVGYALKKARDACSSAYWALRDGVVTGGGTCLVEAIKSLPDTIGGNILKKVLHVPYDQICRNMKITNLIPDNTVQDAVVVVKNAVKNAISIAGTNLTGKTVITLPKTEQPLMMAPYPIQR